MRRLKRLAAALVAAAAAVVAWLLHNRLGGRAKPRQPFPRSQRERAIAEAEEKRRAAQAAEDRANQALEKGAQDEQNDGSLADRVERFNRRMRDKS